MSLIFEVFIELTISFIFYIFLRSHSFTLIIKATGKFPNCAVLALDSWNYCSGEARQPNIHRTAQSSL